MLRSTTHFLLFLLISINSFGQKPLELKSPSGNIGVTVTPGDSLFYAIAVNQKNIIAPSPLALFTNNGNAGVRSHVIKTATRSVNETIINTVPFKRKQIPDHYNELTIRFRENFSIIFRAYDDGVAYRFQTSHKDSIIVNDELASFRFANAATGYFPEVQKRDDLDIFHTSFEEPYKVIALKGITRSKIAFSPVLIDDHVVKTVITESDLIDYPGMFLKGTSRNALQGAFAPYPAEEKVQGGEFKQWTVTARKNFIAKTAGTRSFPWRVIAIAETDTQLLMNDLVFRLASPPASGDWSWVKPGISTDEWICGINLHHVDFKAGLNTASYKYYIDFASRFGIPYVMLDAGWSDNNDLFKITPEMNIEEIAAYAKSKNVNIILWTLSMTLDRQLEAALTRFNQLGVKAIMTDFMDRDDQKTVNFYLRIAKATAQHKIMVMFHGAYKNAGLERTFPNCITREAVLGSEYNIWSDKASPEHDLLIPFIRMVAGPMDYEPGFMQNANQKTFRPLADHVMSQGTRTHQLAMFVAYDSPWQIFSGNPSDALLEPEYMSFLSSLPTVWDDTKALDAKLGDYLVVARKKGNDWYIGAMNDWTERQLEIDLSFLGDGKFRASICEDGVNAAKNAKDYTLRSQEVSREKKLKITLAPGGGYVAKLIRQ